MSLLISVPFGRTIKIAIERCKNILEYIPEAIIIANFATGADTTEFSVHFSDIMNKKIYINDIPRVIVNNSAMHPMFVKNLLHAHITNYLFAVRNGIEFTHIMFLSDMDMFVKKGVYNFIKYYDCGFFHGNAHVKPISLNVNEFAPGEYVYQRQDEFWIKSLYQNPDFPIVYCEQIEGMFFKRELYNEIVDYLEKLPVHYSKAITNMEDGIYGNIYMNLLREKYPIHLPVSIILRDDSICEDPNRLLNIFLKNDIRKNCRSHATHEFYHSFVFGIKRVSYDKNAHHLVEQVVDISNQYMNVLQHNLNIIKKSS